jgi:hypothetical protein
MQIVLDIPDEFLAGLAGPGEDPGRAAMEAWGIEAYRRRRISGYQLRTFLGIGSRHELDGFLKRHEVEKYTVADFEQDLRTIGETESVPAAPRRA